MNKYNAFVTAEKVKLIHIPPKPYRKYNSPGFATSAFSRTTSGEEEEEEEDVGFATPAFSRTTSGEEEEEEEEDVELLGPLFSRVVSIFLWPKLMDCAICGKQKPGWKTVNAIAATEHITLSSAMNSA